MHISKKRSLKCLKVLIILILYHTIVLDCKYLMNMAYENCIKLLWQHTTRIKFIQIFV